jgi:tryptophan synthase alpha chain
LVTYLAAGDPSPQASVVLMRALRDAGVDVLELGVPFSDPTADGPTIQAAHERALAAGVTLADTLGIVERFRHGDDETPVVLMGYMNPIEAMGEDAFATSAAEAGVDGVIVVDLPPEEAVALAGKLNEHDIDLIFLIAPTTTPGRIEKIAARASGFIYYVSRKGTTGAGRLDTADIGERLAIVRRFTNLPVAVGFGIRDRASATALAGVAEAVVVGSALIERIQGADNDEARVSAARALVTDIRAGLDPLEKA